MESPEAAPGGPWARAVLGRGGTAGTAIALLLLGCSGEPDRLEPGAPAPAYQAVTLAGDTVALRDYRGQPVVLNVWATWCGPCRFEMPFLQSLHETHGRRGLQVVGVSVDQRGSEEAVRDFLDEFDVTYDILRDPSMAAMDAFYILGLPATFILDREGRIRLIRHGPVGEGDQAFLGAVRELLESEERAP